MSGLKSKQSQKSKAEPSAKDKLSADFTKRLEEKSREKGDEVLEAAFKESPTKIAEMIARLVSSSEPKPDGFESCQSMREIGIKLLKDIGCDEFELTEDMITDALKAQEAFIAGLKAIRNSAQGAMQ